MKTKLCIGIFLLAAALARAQTNNLTVLLQQGLFEEQANRNLDAAIADYQALALQFDKDRQLAATAVFRLGECYRMQGKTNEAALEYKRIVNEFSDQTTLVTLSRQNLTGLGPVPAEMAPSKNSDAKLWDKVKDLPQAELEKVLPTLVPDATLMQLLQQRGAAETKLSELRVDYSTNYPDYQRQEAVLKTVNRQISEKIDGMMQALKMRAELPQTVVAAVTPSTDEDQEIQRIQQMIQNSPDLINRASSDEGTPLFSAASKDQMRVAGFLLDHGADVNAPAGTHGKIWDTWTPLMAAADYGHKTMVDLLLSRGADVNWKNKGGETALYRAVLRGFQAVTEVLLANHADVKARNISGATPLFSAVQSGQAKIVRMLLAAGADANLNDDKGRTVLNYAIGISPEIFQVLLEAGTNPNTEDSDGRSPLSYAVERDDPKVVKLLLAAKADPNGGKLDAPLLCAIHKNDTVSAELLLQAGAKPNSIGEFDLSGQPGRRGPFGGGGNSQRLIAPLFTPLQLAISENHMPMVQLLLKFKADPNLPQPDGFPLIFAALPHPDILAALLDAGADPNQPDKNVPNTPVWQGESLLMSAVGNSFYETPEGNLAAAKLLLAHGANPNTKDREGNTALHWAVGLGGLEDWTISLPKRELVELLLEHHTNPNVRDNDGKTPLDLLKDKIAQQSFRSFSPETVAKQKAFAGELADLLRQHGALDILPDWDRITVSRPSANFSDVVFHKGTNDYNRFTLFEAIAVHYGLVSANPRLHLPEQKFDPISFMLDGSLQFPNLENVTIHRPSLTDGTWREIKVDVSAKLKSGDCSQDAGLEWGDQVELQETDHPISSKWAGLSNDDRAALRNCLKRRVQLTVKGETTNIVLEANTFGPTITYGAYGKIVATLPQFSLEPVLDNSGLIRASSDLSRVKVTREHDPITGKKREWILDCSGNNSPDFWLRDGDMIEVPGKP
jgi:ankyrin repeat protein